jgi:hypothetical protein
MQWMYEVEAANANGRMTFEFGDKQRAIDACGLLHNEGFTVTAFEVTRNKAGEVVNLTALFSSQWEEENDYHFA